MIKTVLIQEIFLHIYRMDLQELTLLAVFAALILCTLYRKWAGSRLFRPGIGLVLAVWVVTVLWMTVLSRSGGGVYHASWIPLHTYWRVLSGENRELLRSAFMNMLLFYPAGLLLGGLLPSKWSFRKGMLCAAIAFAAFSLTIELNQYLLQLGNAETDDVLHNTLGAVAGFSAFRAFENNTDP